MFEHQNGGECKTDTEGKIGESDACLKQPKTDEEETSLKGEVLNCLFSEISLAHVLRRE